MRVALALVVVAALLHPTAMAQPAPSSIGVAFDQAGTIYQGYVPGFAPPTRLYFLMLNLDQPIQGYENGISISGPGSEDWIVEPSTWPGLEIDLVPEDPFSYIVDIGACVGTAGSNYLIKTFDFSYFISPNAPIDTLVCVGPPGSHPTSIPGFPSYTSCEPALYVSDVYPDNFDPVPDGCAIINSSIVATEETTWGVVKASY